MKQTQLPKLTRTFRMGFLAGVILSLFVYGFARILFYEFSFTAREEVINFFKIITAGGVIVSVAATMFLLLEMVLQYFSTLKISLPSLNFRSGSNNIEISDYPMAELNTPS